MKTGISCRLSVAEDGQKRVLSLPSVRTEILVDLLARGMDCRFTARGNSMRPLIRDGDVVVLSPYSNRPPRLGDVAAAVNPETGRLLVHRVIGKRPGWSLTKGDNAAAADGWFPDRHLPGRVTEVQRNGELKTLGLGPEGLSLAALSRLGLFLFMVVFDAFAAQLVSISERKALWHARQQHWVERPTTPDTDQITVSVWATTPQLKLANSG